MDAITFLQTQSTDYQQHLSQVTELTATLKLQHNMETLKTIPKKYQPRHLKASDASLTEEFRKEYSELFFKHLKKVITNNQIALQLHTSALTSIIVQTEGYLSKSPLPSAEILYHKFLRENHINGRTPIPELQRKLQGTAPTLSTQPKRRRQKRKCPTPAPPATKHRSQDQDHFLSVGPEEIPTIS